MKQIRNRALLSVFNYLGKSEKISGNKIARNPLFLEGNHNFGYW